VPRKIPLAVWLVLPLAYFLYFFRLGGAGLLGPDEPRYAWIGRAMAQSGDWITPRLYGAPWFEKPALLYWMIAAGFRAGFGPDVAPRLPVALLGTAFLFFYWWILKREFGCRAAWLATLVLGTSVAWMAFSQAAVTDLPLTVTFGAAMLLALPWVSKRETRWLPAASALLGAAALAKGLVPLALAAPLVMRARWWRDVVKPRVVLPFCLVALPWYVLCYARNGWPFVEEFFVRHTFGRFVSTELQHVQPWWFYLPRTPALLLPWTPLLILVVMAGWRREPRRLFLLLWVVCGLVLFSASVNKLYGYVLPLLPALAAMAGIALDEARDARGWLASCAALLVAFPAAAPILPAAVANEWAAAPRVAFDWTWLTPIVAVAGAWWLEARGWRIAAALVVAAGAGAGLTYLKVRCEPEMERVSTARAAAEEAARHRGEICGEPMRRDWQYGLNYYLGTVLPPCEDKSLPFHVLQEPGRAPEVRRAEPGTGTAPGAATVDPH
jgi:4-amino-4-deoxy-L-arabinose transferase-like glycosyltransferase